MCRDASLSRVYQSFTVIVTSVSECHSLTDTVIRSVNNTGTKCESICSVPVVSVGLTRSYRDICGFVALKHIYIICKYIPHPNVPWIFGSSIVSCKIWNVVETYPLLRRSLPVRRGLAPSDSTSTPRTTTFLGQKHLPYSAFLEVPYFWRSGTPLRFCSTRNNSSAIHESWSNPPFLTHSTRFPCSHQTTFWFDTDLSSRLCSGSFVFHIWNTAHLHNQVSSLEFVRWKQHCTLLSNADGRHRVSVSVHILANNAIRAHHASAHGGLSANVLSYIFLNDSIELLDGRAFHSLAVVGGLPS